MLSQIEWGVQNGPIAKNEVYKNDGRANKSNYRQIRFFSVSKICAFLVMIKKRNKKKTAPESNAFCAAIPKDLLKSSDCICHYLLIAKRLWIRLKCIEAYL